MPFIEARTIPNVITVGRILVAPAVFVLILTPAFWARLLGFVLFGQMVPLTTWLGALVIFRPVRQSATPTEPLLPRPGRSASASRPGDPSPSWLGDTASNEG